MLLAKYSEAMSGANIDYYEQNAEEFFASTVLVDMATLHGRFLAHIPFGGHILDAGCGSGRDAKAFSNLGFRVTAFDGAPSLARLASEHLGQTVSVRKFADIDEVACYDGVWACASLLHLPLSAVPDAIDRLWKALKPGGSLYFSFKYGTGERHRNGRSFTDADESIVLNWLGSLAGLAEREIWITQDQRSERAEEWINVLALKVHTSSDKLITGGDNPFLPHLCAAIGQADEIDIAVAFTKVTGLRLASRFP